jgi:hypothetical protein
MHYFRLIAEFHYKLQNITKNTQSKNREKKTLISIVFDDKCFTS